MVTLLTLSNALVPLARGSGRAQGDSCSSAWVVSCSKERLPPRQRQERGRTVPWTSPQPVSSLSPVPSPVLQTLLPGHLLWHPVHWRQNTMPAPRPYCKQGPEVQKHGRRAGSPPSLTTYPALPCLSAGHCPFHAPSGSQPVSSILRWKSIHRG